RQDRRHRPPALGRRHARPRRRGGEHLPARAGQGDRQEPGRAGASRGRDTTRAERDGVAAARRTLATAAKNDVRVVLPVDVIVAKEVTRGTEYKTLQAEQIATSWHILDLDMER